jgi:aminopeptidase N
MGLKILFLLSLLGQAQRFEAPAPRLRRDRAVDLLKLTLTITPDLSKSSYEAEAVHRFKVLAPELKVLELDAAQLDIKEASVPFEAKDDKLFLKFAKPLKEGEEATVRIAYRSTQSHLGLHFFKKDAAYPGQPDLMWSKGETERTRHWIPIYDYPNERLQSELIVNVPPGFSAISNGKLVSVSDDKTKWHWLQERPHAPYLITLAVGRFTPVVLSKDGPPMTVWAPEGREKDVERTYSKTSAMVKLFEELTAFPYPWAKYDQVLLYGFRWGGMEDTSAVMLTDRALLDERAALDEDWDGLISHELAHQWFGDLTTCKDWSHMWLNEGFADYLAALWTLKDKGQDEFELEMDGSAEWFFGSSKVSMVTDRYKESDDMFNANSYGKGAWVLHRLRYELGDELFWKSIRLYLSRVADQPSETEDLRQAVEDATGRPMEAFFRSWAYSAGHLQLTLSASWDAAAKKLDLTVTQDQKEPIELKTTVELDGQSREVVLKGRRTSFSWPLASRPKTFRFDPSYSLPAEYELELPEDWLLAALRSDKSVAQRLRAVRALSGRRKPALRAAFKKCILEDPFWGVAAACADALDDAWMLADAGGHLNLHPKTRRAIAVALGRFPGEIWAFPPLANYRTDPTYGVVAAALQSMGALRQPHARPILVEHLQKDSYNDVIRKAALAGLGALRDESTRPLLEEWAAKGKPVSARVSALAALAALGGEASRLLLEKTLKEDEDRMIRQAAAQALGALGDPAAVDVLLALQAHERDPRIRIRSLEASSSSLSKLRRGTLPELLKRAEAVSRRVAELQK